LLRVYNVVSRNKKRHENYEARLVFLNVSSTLNNEIPEGCQKIAAVRRRMDPARVSTFRCVRKIAKRDC
jgi:hypothetical protein